MDYGNQKIRKLLIKIGKSIIFIFANSFNTEDLIAICVCEV